MNKKVNEKNNTSEERLKIKEVKKLKNKNKILEFIKVAGIGTSLYIYYLSFLSIFGKGFGIESDYPIIFILFIMFVTHSSKKNFVHGIPKLQQENNELIVQLQNEIEKEEELERVK